MGEAKEIAPLLVVMLAPSATGPPPDWERAPDMERVIAGPKVAVPLLTKVNGPVADAVTELENWKFVPVKEMPLAVDVERAPLNVEVPDPADCVILPAVMAAAVMLLALVNVTEVKAVAPIVDAVMLPVPAVRVKACAPVTEGRVMSPTPAPLDKEVSFVKVIGLVKVMG